MTKKVSNARIHSYMCMFSENDKVNLVTQRNYDKKRHKSCVSEFTLASCGSEMVVASFRGREFYDLLRTCAAENLYNLIDICHVRFRTYL